MQAAPSYGSFFLHPNANMTNRIIARDLMAWEAA
jgi:hypothetical protein